MSTDIHRQTAAVIFGVPENEVTPDQRRAGKVVNNWDLYGRKYPSVAEALAQEDTPANADFKRKRAEAILAGYQAYYGEMNRRLLTDGPYEGNRAGMTVDAGRLASWSPRPHNIPIRTEEGRRIRGLFNPYWGTHRYVGPMEKAEIREHSRPLAISFVLRGLV